jgi:hypothetical protein
MPRRVIQGGWRQQTQAKRLLESGQPAEQGLVILVRSSGPGIGLIHKAHPLEHEEPEVFSRLLQLGPELGADRTCLADEGWSDPRARVSQSSSTGQTALEGLAHLNTPHMIGNTAWDKAAPIKLKARKREPAQMLRIRPADAFMTTHAHTLPAPYATVPPRVW